MAEWIWMREEDVSSYNYENLEEHIKFSKNNHGVKKKRMTTNSN